jgi:hypothetical protein
MADLTDEDREVALRRVRDNFEVFALHCLKIKNKEGKVVPFVLNRAQQYVHDRLEEQKAKTGKVRALILKGRQQGLSTLIGARFYHQVSMWARSAFIVAHEDKAVTSLFEMVKRYQSHNPLAPSTKASNAKELIFSAIDAGYKLASAGTDDVGRGNTAQLIHASEYGFWRNPQQHLAGLGNTMGDVAGSEFVIESTANGIGNSFHQLWQAAEAGQGDFIPIFVAWHWNDEYRAPLKADFSKTEAEQVLVDVYHLDDEQLQWRRNKISSYGDGYEWLFDQEFPNCPSDAFVTSTNNPLLSPASVMAAVNSSHRDDSAPLIIGCDPAGDGVENADRTAIAFRRGRMCFRLEYHQGLDTMQIVGKLAEYNRDMKPDAIFVDKGGLGAGVYDRLRELNIAVIGVNSATKANDSERYENKRAEMWWLMQAWFLDQPCRIPNNAALISDLTAPQPKVSSNGRKLLEKKDAMKARGLRSCDGGDALALTFAEPIASRTPELAQYRQRAKPAATIAGY